MENKRTILFNSEDVRKLIVQAFAASYRSPALSELDNPEYHIGGVVKRDAKGEIATRNVDYAKIPPRLWLVKDAGGIYLLSNAKAELYATEEVGPAYARLTEPNESGGISSREADRLLGKSRVWMAIPTVPFMTAIRRARGTIAVEICDKPLSRFEKLKRFVVGMLARDKTFPTVVVAINC